MYSIYDRIYIVSLYEVRVGKPERRRRRRRGVGRATQDCDRPDRKAWGGRETKVGTERMSEGDGGWEQKSASERKGLALYMPFRSRRTEWREYNHVTGSSPPSVEYRMCGLRGLRPTCPLIEQGFPIRAYRVISDPYFRISYHNPGRFIMSKRYLIEKLVDDKDQQQYLDGYLAEVPGAVEQDGIKIGSYIMWTLIDNSE